MKKAMNQSTMTRLLNFGTILLMIVSMILFLVSSSMNSKIDKTNNMRFELIDNAYRFLNASVKLTSDVRQYAATGDISYYNAYMKEINETHDRETGVANMKDIGLSSQELTMVEDMMALSNQLVPLEEQSMELVKKGNRTEAIELVSGEKYVPVADNIKQLQTDFLNALSDRTAEEVDALQLQTKIFQSISIGFMVIMIIIQLISLTVIQKKLLNPLRLIQEEMGEIAKGNLSNPVQLEPDTSEIGMLVYAITTTKKELNSYIHDISDKLAQMASGDMLIEVNLEYLGDFEPIKEAMIQISSSLRETLQQIQQAAEQVLAGAEQVSMGAQSLAQGSTEQASTLQEIASSFTEVAGEAQKNADYSMEAETMAVEATAAIDNSSNRMRSLMEAMENVNQHSLQIRQIIKSIEDIAFQTNILALNAAVEAARAGAAGKGFAVVADEVRNLAKKSAEAAANTAEMIENTVKAVNEGMTISHQAVEDLNVIVEGSQKTTTLVRSVSEGSRRQADVIGDVQNGMDQVTSVVQTNSATSEESAATAEELSSQANVMRQLVGRFRV